MTTFYNFSGGMESAAMLVVDAERIRETGAIIQWADTGKHFPEMAQSVAQIEAALGVKIVAVPRRITFDEFLFDRGGMLRKGKTDCSRRMKRSNLARHIKSHAPPYEVNLGFNATETDRADSFVDRNERPWMHWRFPLIERGIYREQTWDICEKAGFSILVGMYRKMGRFDCFWCPNQRPSQALGVARHYPELAAQWMAAEARKGHGFMPIPLKVLIEKNARQPDLFSADTGCSCFGGDDSFSDEVEAYDIPLRDEGPTTPEVSDER